MIINQLLRVLNLLKKIDKLTAAKLLSQNDIDEAQSSIKWLKYRQCSLEKILPEYENFDNCNVEKVIEIIVELGREVGDIAECLKDIDDLLTLVAKRYRTYLDESNIKY